MECATWEVEFRGGLDIVLKLPAPVPFGERGVFLGPPLLLRRSPTSKELYLQI